MSTLFNLKVPFKEKQESHHPWANTIKDYYSHKIKTAHNSANNPQIPKSKEKLPNNDRITFTVIGNRVTKEFIYCVNLIKFLHKYRWKIFAAPIVKGVTGVEWPSIWNSLKIDFGGYAYCLRNQVAVLINNKFLGGEQELKKFIETNYTCHLQLDYFNESVKQFSGFIKSSGRPCVYMHFAIDGDHVGTMIFMLYADVLPNTCENFLRLCKTRRGGYSGTPVHRIVKDGWIQCGGYSLKETKLSCENFIVPHDRRGVLCMANNGRHCDCSTQFFVLSQPAPWMAYKYVAFGQLIDGEKTLQKIEAVSTWYESPTKDIVIHRAGILNIDCQDIAINKGTHAYIQGHIDDLVVIGNLFMEVIMEQVFLEIELRHIVKLRQETEAAEEEKDRGLHETRRFIRKKEDIHKQIEKSDTDNENSEFDVEMYDYEPEEYEYKRASSVKSPGEPEVERPFYIPLTDVTDPDDVDSIFDLKKFLRGDYCLESDLDKNINKDLIIPSKDSYPSGLVNFFDQTSEEYVSDESLNSEDEREIKRYIKFHVDRVSFAGGTIKNIAKRQGKINLLEGSRKSQLITDEELRRFRMAMTQHRRSSTPKRVIVTTPDNEKESAIKIRRRQTGFVRPADLQKLRAISMSLVEEEESTSRRVRIAATGSSAMGGSGRAKPRQRPRRQTGYVQGAQDSDEESDTQVHRQSVLKRLYDDVAADEPGPTLKDYKPMTVMQKDNFLILTYSPPDFQKVEDKERLRHHSLAANDDSFDDLLNIQHGKQCARKVSSDYVKTIDQAEHKAENSIRSLEFAKTRPSMSVLEYQKKNQKYQMELSKTKETNTSTKGLRLPGDTPLYNSVNDLNSTT